MLFVRAAGREGGSPPPYARLLTAQYARYAQIYTLEGQYLDDTANTGNVVVVRPTQVSRMCVSRFPEFSSRGS